MPLTRFFLPATLLLALIVACNRDDQPQPTTGSPGNEIPPQASASKPVAAPHAQATHTQPPGSGLPDPLRGTVKETIDSQGYTYVLLASEQGDIWAAAKQFAVAVGDEVELAGLMPMHGFHSSSLNRTFQVIQFVDRARVVAGKLVAGPLPLQPGSPTPQMPPGHPPIGQLMPPSKATPVTPTEPGEIQPLPDGTTVAALFDNRTELQDQRVKFRGRVVKANRNILGRNWLHIQDGTGEPGRNDITVTSQADFAPPGSIVIVEGTLHLKRDFGAGYSYDVIVEDATVTAATPQPPAAQPGTANPHE